jgi:hypothetical protein
MARKPKEEEVQIVTGKRDTEEVTDLQVRIKDEVIGEIYQGENDRHYKATNKEGHQVIAVSIEDAVQTILADYNLHK